MAEITVHCLVRNEERFVRAALLSVLPLARRVLLYDTGSTDDTLGAIASIGSDRIQITRKRDAGPQALTEYRNEMIEQTTTEWFMLVDGDEIYPARAARRIVEELPTVPPTVHRIVGSRRHFVGSLNFVSPPDALGRIFRTRRIRIRKDYPYQTSCLRDDPLAPHDRFSMALPTDIFFFHCSHLRRSSKDAELGRFRGWRKLPFPAMPYFGPWPETLEPDGVATRVTPGLLARWVGLNARILGARLRSRMSSHRLRLRAAAHLGPTRRSGVS